MDEKKKKRIVIAIVCSIISISVLGLIFWGGISGFFGSPIEITDTNIEMKNHILYGDYAEISGIAHNTGNNMLTVTIGAKC